MCSSVHPFTEKGKNGQRAAIVTDCNQGTWYLIAALFCCRLEDGLHVIKHLVLVSNEFVLHDFAVHLKDAATVGDLHPIQIVLPPF